MAGANCCVVCCKNNTIKNKSVSWHIFPKNKQLKKAWIKAINRRDKSKKLWKPSITSKVCGIHFNISGIKRKCDFQPKYFLKPVQQIIHCPEMGIVAPDYQHQIEIDEADTEIVNVIDTTCKYECVVKQEDTIPDHNYALKENTLTKFIFNIKNDMSEQKECINNLNNELYQLRQANYELVKKYQIEVTKNDSLSKKVSKSESQINHLRLQQDMFKAKLKTNRLNNLWKQT